ncbi:hypothetical protein [Cellvibrio sp. UBA7661]|uniref:hypothetical protein n=1 Tax=Cellvibrio sp. UBA7661 TaxID=1946311 RepID=UPI002F3599BC
MSEVVGVTKVQMILLRAMYLLVVVGLGLTIWPSIIVPETRVTDPHSVIQSMLGAFSLLALVGLRYPLQLLPILLFELMWKTLWVLVFALPVWLQTGLDEYAKGVLFACVMGIVLTPFVIPWRYVMAKLR